jgi:3',5'-cyclic AMP phosphodiesterase CpdA
MTLLLQISDAHFGTERPDVVEALLQLAASERPDLVVLSGDITQRARRGQFAAARAFVGRLGTTPVLAVPGNHDIPLFDVFARVLYPYANYRRAFGHELEPVFESDNALIIGLNSARPSRHTEGEVSEEQIERVARRLEQAAAAQLRVIVMHHPVAAMDAGYTQHLLHGREHAIRQWAKAGADLIVGGHAHLPYALPLADRMTLAQPVWVVQAGTALSTRVRAGIPNSVNLIRYDADATCERAAYVARFDYAEDTKTFIQMSRQRLALAAARSA